MFDQNLIKRMNLTVVFVFGVSYISVPNYVYVWGYIMKQLFSVFMCALLVSGLFFACMACMGTVQAEPTITKLPVPKLVSVTYADHSYYVSGSTSIDAFTGNTVETPGYYVDDRTLTMVIDKKNIDMEAPGYFYYVIRMKGFYSNEWVAEGVWVAPHFTSTASNSQLATLVFTTRRSSYSAQPDTTDLYCGDGCLRLPLTGQADFQVQIIERQNVYHQSDIGWFSMWIETLVAESDWSNIKTFAMGQYEHNEVPNQPNYMSNQTSTNQTGEFGVNLAGLSLFELSLGLVLCAIIAVLAIVLVRERKTRHKHDDDSSIQNMAAS